MKQWYALYVFRARSWNNGMHCMSLYILIFMEMFYELFGLCVALVQIMACRLVGAKPLSKPMLSGGIQLTVIWDTKPLM